MSASLDQLLNAALGLSLDERSALARALLESMQEPEPGAEKAWKEEILRRVRDLDAGKTRFVSSEEAHARARAAAAKSPRED